MIGESTKNGPRKGEPRYWATGMTKNTFLGGPQGGRLMETACDNCKQKQFCILAFRFIGCFTLERWTSNINLIKLPGSSLV